MPCASRGGLAELACCNQFPAALLQRLPRGRGEALFIHYSGSECCYQHFLPVFRVRQFTNKPEIMLMLRARIAVLKAKERRP